MKASTFIGVSLDGFIARHSGSFDFLPEGGGEPHGYDEFMASVDALVIGRHTYGVVLAFDAWPYGTKPLLRAQHPPDPTRSARWRCGAHERGAHANHPAAQTRGISHVYVDGGITIQQFLQAGLIQRLIITRVPVLIGTGIALFGAVPQDIRLKHVATHAYASGLVKSEYEVIGPR